MVFNAAQCRMARAALQLGVRELAALAKVSPNTIARLERGEALHDRTLHAIRTALEAAGVEFIDGDASGVRLHRKVLANMEINPNSGISFVVIRAVWGNDFVIIQIDNQTIDDSACLIDPSPADRQSLVECNLGVVQLVAENKLNAGNFYTDNDTLVVKILSVDLPRLHKPSAT